MLHTLPEDELPKDFMPDIHQKMQLVLANTKVQNDHNVVILNEWLQHVYSPETGLQTTTTHLCHRLTYSTAGNTFDVLKKHATYYNDVLGVSDESLQRLETLGEGWQPDKLGSWIEFNTLGANAGWYFPANLSIEQLLGAFDESNINRRILYHWTKYNDEFSCTYYGESFIEPRIQQIGLLLNADLDLASQYHKAMALADLFKVPAFPPVLVEIFELYEAQQLTVSLWLSPKGVLKFGLRVHQPSAKLMMALYMLCGLDKKDEESLTLIHATMEKLAWVEIQYTADGLVSEVGFS